MKKIKGLLYCTKAKPYLYKTEETTYPAYPIGYHTDKDLKFKLNNTYELANLNGKIVAECDFEVEEHKETTNDWLCMSLREKIIFGNMCEKASIDELECYEYANGKPLYAIHIKNLHIFDEPRELSEYYYYDDVRLTKAPQNMMYCYDNEGNKYVVISIQPQWMCLILNRIKDVEVRKKVLKEMLENE